MTEHVQTFKIYKLYFLEIPPNVSSQEDIFKAYIEEFHPKKL